MHSISLRCFGVGDGWPSAERDHSSYLYQVEDQALLIDCGEPISRGFKAAGLNYDTIDRIFLSHLHFDHIGGFFMLIQGFWLEKRHKELPVHVPGDGVTPIRELLQAGCIFDELLPFRLRYEPLLAGQAVTSGPVRITPLASSHLFGFRKRFAAKYPQRYEAFSFLMETDSLRIGHSADIGAIEDLAPMFEHRLDLLVCELAHVEPEKLFRYLAKREIGRILFVHLARECVANFKEIQALANQILGSDRLAWPRDGERFDFQLTAPPTREK